MSTKKPLLDIKFKEDQETVSEGLGLSDEQCHAILKKVDQLMKRSTTTSNTARLIVEHYTENPAELAFALMIIIPQEQRLGSDPLEAIMRMAKMN